MRVDVFLSRVGLVKRRARATELCRVGLVYINGVPVRSASQTLAVGDQLRYCWHDCWQTIIVVALPHKDIAKVQVAAYYCFVDFGKHTAASAGLMLEGKPASG